MKKGWLVFFILLIISFLVLLYFSDWSFKTLKTNVTRFVENTIDDIKSSNQSYTYTESANVSDSTEDEDSSESTNKTSLLDKIIQEKNLMSSSLTTNKEDTESTDLKANTANEVQNKTLK